MSIVHDVLRNLYHWFLRPDPIKALKMRGLIVGSNVTIEGEVSLDWSHCWHIEIGDDVTIAPRVQVLAHDASTKMHLGLTRIGRVRIGNRVFVGAATIILPGVKIGDDVVIGAGSIVSQDIPAGVVAAGNPAKRICSLEEYLEKKRAEVDAGPTFGVEYTDQEKPTMAMKAEMNGKMKEGIGYVV